MHSDAKQKGMALTQVICLISTAFLALCLCAVIPDNVSGDSGAYYSEAARDGFLECNEVSYPPVGVPSVWDTEDYLAVSNSRLTKPSIHYIIERSFISFDTSAIPDTAIIQSVLLKLRLDACTYTDSFTVDVHASNYDTLDAGDWSTFGAIQGSLFSGYAGVSESWYSIACSATTIDRNGHSGFMLKLSTDNETTPTGLNYITFYSGETAYAPTLSVVWTEGGIAYSIELTTGSYLNSSMYPDVEQWNLTYERWNFEFATVPNAENVTIFKSNASWEFLGMAPLCNYTLTNESLNLTDVYDSITYRVWFAVPKSSAWTTLFIRLYDAFTGEGFYWEQWNIEICSGSPWNNTTAETVPTAEYRVEPNEVYTLRVLDFFGNPIVNQTVTSYAEEVFVSVSIPVYSYKFYNQNPSFTLLRIYYNLTGTPYSEFIPPYDYVNRYLKSGTYQFMITLYDDEGIVGDTYTWTRTIPSATFPGAGYVILEGDTITEAIVAANGAKALVEVVADLVAPEMLWIGYTVPQIPSYLLTISSFVINENLYMVNGNILDTGTGTSITLESPTPDNSISALTSRDDLRFSGNVSTHVIVNDTDSGSTVLNSLTLPATYELDGSEYSVWANSSISVARDCDWRWHRAFTWQYISETDVYVGEVTVSNTVGLNWRNTTLFIPFANASYIANRTLKVYDMNNSVYLEEGTHFVSSETGIYLWFDRWNASVTRGFRVTYTMYNDTWDQVPASVLVNTLGNGVDVTQEWNEMQYYFAIARWVNSYREAYDGPLHIQLQMPVSIEPTSVIVLTVNGAIVLDAVVSGTTVTIPRIQLAPGSLVEYTILFNSKEVNSILDIKAGNLPIALLVAVIATATLIFGLYAVTQKKEYLRIPGKVALGIGVLCLMFLVVLFFYYMGIAT